jgi:hypothetical protein
VWTRGPLVRATCELTVERWFRAAGVPKGPWAFDLNSACFSTKKPVEFQVSCGAAVFCLPLGEFAGATQ